MDSHDSPSNRATDYCTSVMGSKINTSLTRLLNIQTPVVGAAMARASGGALAAEVTKAGGFGFLSAGVQTSSWVKQELELARSLLGPSSPRLPIGIGFLGWEIEQNPEAVKILDQVLEFKGGVQAVWLSFGVDIGKWVKYVRAKDPGTLVFVQVNTEEEALRAYREWEVDALIMQGNEGGGHGLGSAPPLLSLFPAVLRSLTSAAKGTLNRPLPPILAAGGLATGSHLASLLTLGASGIVLGTRLLATPESLISPRQKSLLIRATGNATIRSTIFDDVMNIRHYWPEGTTGRALVVEKMIQDELDGVNLVERRKRWENEKQGAYEIVWAGTGVGLVNEINNAADVIREVHEEAVDALRVASSLVVPV